MKKVTDTIVKHTYDLRPGDALKVVWLQEGLRYIYPYDYEVRMLDSPLHATDTRLSD